MFTPSGSLRMISEVTSRATSILRRPSILRSGRPSRIEPEASRISSNCGASMRAKRSPVATTWIRPGSRLSSARSQ